MLAYGRVRSQSLIDDGPHNSFKLPNRRSLLLSLMQISASAASLSPMTKVSFFCSCRRSLRAVTLSVSILSLVLSQPWLCTLHVQHVVILLPLYIPSVFPCSPHTLPPPHATCCFARGSTNCDRSSSASPCTSRCTSSKTPSDPTRCRN